MLRPELVQDEISIKPPFNDDVPVRTNGDSSSDNALINVNY